MIKTPEEIEKMRVAGQLTAKVLEAVTPIIKPGITTAAIDEFKYGISDRGASIRIPIGTVERGWKGWLEDRRPNSAADPYKVAARIVKTVKSAEEIAMPKTNGKLKEQLVA